MKEGLTIAKRVCQAKMTNFRDVKEGSLLQEGSIGRAQSFDIERRNTGDARTMHFCRVRHTRERCILTTQSDNSHIHIVLDTEWSMRG